MRNFFIACTIAGSLGSLGSPGQAETNHQPYAGFEAREIAALSAEDIAELEAGGGWGLALPAELNGYPGPKHVLELAQALELSDAQRLQMEEIFDEMRAEAIAAGAAYIAAERALDRAFDQGEASAAELRALTGAAGAARADLQFVHLSRHLQTVEILDDGQIAQYAALRGYGADPCSSVPEGHNEAMWRRHNGCSD